MENWDKLYIFIENFANGFRKEIVSLRNLADATFIREQNIEKYVHFYFENIILLWKILELKESIE